MERIGDIMEKDKAKYFLSVRNSKAVASADVALDSITVLSGVNASGKSTLARILHEIINLNAQYPVLLKRYAWVPVREWAAQIVLFKDRLLKPTAGVLSAISVQNSVRSFEDRFSSEGLADVLDSLERFVLQTISDYVAVAGNGDAKRAFMAFVRAVGVGEDLASDVEAVLNVFRNKKARALERYANASSIRNYEVYNHVRELKFDISWLTDAERVELYEDGEPVYAVHRNADTQLLDRTFALKEIFGVRQSLYIASPWVSIPQMTNDGGVVMKYDDFPHYPVSGGVRGDSDLFSEIGDEIYADESTGRKRWMVRIAGCSKPIDLSDCATGFKSMAILNILFKGGFLNSETLLIVDEPEAHLHPQWVVAYARILVLIAKHLKVRMLLTSHNPDMISSLKVISQAEGLSGVRFYVANEHVANGLRQYDYESLGMNIEPIFRKFNVALDRIDTYGGKSATRSLDDDFE